MNILLTNDDGIHAPGLCALVAGMPAGVNVVVVAPATERSACSHSISLGQKLRVEENLKKRIPEYAVHGTPADCIKFAISELSHFIPSLVISGINQGANTGISVYYSGTISGAREALINGIPAMAVSLCSRTFQDFSASVAVVSMLIEGYRLPLFPRHMMLNVNIPPLPVSEIDGVKITKQAASRFIEEFVKEEAHDGKQIYTLAGEIELMDPDGTSDEEAVSNGFVSVTPLKLDVTDYEAIHTLKYWMNKVKSSGGVPWQNPI
ncbi:MAG: 5'/3'-nucleotidase SurE [Candidatus Omnitrophica bacterium]|nr:5'/3'-nucleotidase SurE [Candidatus Omnitrophota bacterium]